MNYEKRTDCEFFEMKRWEHDCGDCQTDGHYLCVGCKNIASFEEMELSDNRMRYYDKKEKERIEAEKLSDYEDDEPEFERCSDCDGHDACEDFGCAIKAGIIQSSEW